MPSVRFVCARFGFGFAAILTTVRFIERKERFDAAGKVGTFVLRFDPKNTILLGLLSLDRIYPELVCATSHSSPTDSTGHPSTDSGSHTYGSTRVLPTLNCMLHVASRTAAAPTGGSPHPLQRQPKLRSYGCSDARTDSSDDGCCNDDAADESADAKRCFTRLDDPSLRSDKPLPLHTHH